MMRRRQHVPSTALALALATVLTACSPGGGDFGPPIVPTELDFLLFGGPEELAAYTQVADAFNAANPDVVVNVSTVAKQDDLLARLTAGFAAGSPPDVFLINFRKYGLYAEQGVLEPVWEHLDFSATLSKDDFFAEPMRAFQFTGTRQTCLPQNISSLVTYLNLDLFEAVGLAPPASGDTWDWNEFKQAAAAISDSGIGQANADEVYGIGTSPGLIRLAPMVWSNGGEVVDNDRDPGALTLDSPQATEALEFFASLVPERLAPDDLQEQGRDARARFIDGNLGMFWSSRREVPTFREGIGDAFAWDVAPFPIAPDRPGHPGESVTMLHSDAFCLSSAAAGGNPGWAWKFVEFALSADGGAPVLAESGRTVPSNIEVANSPAFLRDDVPPANNQVFLDNAAIARATPSTATWNEVESQADDILEELFYGRMTLDQALERFAAIRFR